MKYQIILAVLALLEFPLQAQETFFKIFETEYFDQSFDAVETVNGDFLIIGERALSYLEDTTYGYILKIDPEGNSQKDTIFGTLGKWARFSFIKRMPFESTNYLVGGWSDSSNLGVIFNNMTVLIINEELNQLSGAIFTSPPNYVYHPWKAEIIYDSLLYILSFYYPPGINCQIAILKIQLPFDSLVAYHSPEISIHNPYDLIYRYPDSVLHVFYIGPLFMESSPSKILIIDKNLNYISTCDGPPYILTSICSTPYNDTSYLLTGSGISQEYQAKQHIMVYLLNSNNDTIKKLEYFNDPDTILYAGGGTNTAINDESIYVTGIYNFNPSTYPWQTTPTWIQLTRTDLDLNIISHHFYGGNQLYIPYSAISTSDGGVLITGWTWNYNIPGNMLRNIFVLKVDSTGIITDIPEIDSWKMNDAILCPNPGDAYCVAVLAAQHPEATLLIYDLSGRIMLEQQLNQYRTRILTAGLPAGTYVYQFLSREKIIGSGKWVKR
jgi:hypothetical protein